MSELRSMRIKVLQRIENRHKNRLIVSDQVLKFKSSTQLEKCWVELRSWTQELKLNWEAWLNNSIWKLDSIQQDIR